MCVVLMLQDTNEYSERHVYLELYQNLYDITLFFFLIYKWFNSNLENYFFKKENYKIVKV